MASRLPRRCEACAAAIPARPLREAVAPRPVGMHRTALQSREPPQNNVNAAGSPALGITPPPPPLLAARHALGPMLRFGSVH